MIEKKVLFIPIFIDTTKNSILLFNENPFYSNWNFEDENHFLINYVLHNEDLDDYKLIQERIDFIENYDFKEIISKYELNENYIILIIFKDENYFNTFSKFNVSSINSNFKKEFQVFEFNKENKIKELISSLK